MSDRGRSLTGKAKQEVDGGNKKIYESVCYEWENILWLGGTKENITKSWPLLHENKGKDKQSQYDVQ